MITPAVAIAPIRPWAYAKEDPVIKIARAIKTHGCASVWRIVIVAV
jgi:DNA-directed RNA polymerase subunit H (RpoH/RPB5)